METDPANQTYRFSIGAEDPKRDGDGWNPHPWVRHPKDLAEAGQDGIVNDQAAPDNPASGT